MSKSINDIRCEFMDNSNELKINIIKYHSIVNSLQNINLLSFKIIKNQEKFTSLFKFIIDLNEKITQFNDNFKDVIKEEELPNSKIDKTSFPDLKEKPSTMNPMMNPMMFDFPVPDFKEKPSTPESNQDMNSTMNPMMGGMGMNPMMFGFPSPMFYPPFQKQSPTKENESENTESTNKTNKEDLN